MKTQIFRLLMSGTSPRKDLHHNWLTELASSLFTRPDKKIAVINKSDIKIIAILTSDPNERRRELTSSDIDVSLSGSVTDISASTGLKGSVSIQWSDKKLYKEIHPIESGGQWIFNTESDGKHYLTILKAEKEGSSYAIIGASSYVPIGYEYIIGNDMPIIEGLTVPGSVVVKGLNLYTATEDKDDDGEDEDNKVTPFTEKDKRDREKDKKERAKTEDKEIVKPSIVKKVAPFNPGLVGTSIMARPDYKHFLGMKVEKKISVRNNRSHPIYAILSSMPDKSGVPVHHEAVMIAPRGGTEYSCFSKKNELTVIVADDDGNFVQEGSNCIVVRWKRVLEIGNEWTAHSKMVTHPVPMKNLEQFI